MGFQKRTVEYSQRMSLGVFAQTKVKEFGRKGRSEHAKTYFLHWKYPCMLYKIDRSSNRWTYPSSVIQHGRVGFFPSVLPWHVKAFVAACGWLHWARIWWDGCRQNEEAYGVELNCIQLFADAVIHSMWIRGVWASWHCVSWALHQASPPKLTTPRGGQILHQSWLQRELLGAQHRQVSSSKISAPGFQASLQRKHRDKLIPWI